MHVKCSYWWHCNLQCQGAIDEGRSDEELDLKVKARMNVTCDKGDSLLHMYAKRVCNLTIPATELVAAVVVCVKYGELIKEAWIFTVFWRLRALVSGRW